MTALVVDTSAMVAILSGEHGGEWLATQLGAATDRVMAAPTVLELSIVLEARAPTAVGIARRALRDAGIRVVAFDDELADISQEAWRRFGKGRAPAGLDLGDCFTYAVARRLGHPVLCVGDDFVRTDLTVVRPPG